jgi:hypothetical protein
VRNHNRKYKAAEQRVFEASGNQNDSMPHHFFITARMEPNLYLFWCWSLMHVLVHTTTRNHTKFSTFEITKFIILSIGTRVGPTSMYRQNFPGSHLYLARPVGRRSGRRQEPEPIAINFALGIQVHTQSTFARVTDWW